MLLRIEGNLFLDQREFEGAANREMVYKSHIAIENDFIYTV